MVFKKGLKTALFSLATIGFMASASANEHVDLKPKTALSQPANIFQEKNLENLADEITTNELMWDNKQLENADEEFFGESFKIQKSGAASMASALMDFFLKTPGRFKRVQFIGPMMFGKNKINYKELEWKKFDTQHFTLYAYDTNFLDDAIGLSELSYDNLSEKFRNKRADLKVNSYFYMTRRDFEQTRFFPWLVPEGLGGFTFTRKKEKNRVVVPFEGDLSNYNHVLTHEYVHWHDIQLQDHMKKVKESEHELPLWMTEGTAENFSKEWDASDETVIRDAYYHDFFFPIQHLPYIRGTWLMYKEGHMINKFIEEKFGQDKIVEFRKNLDLENFGENIKKTLGVDLKTLNNLIYAHLNEKYEERVVEEDIVSKSIALGNGKLLASHGKFFINGKIQDRRHKLYINYLDDFNQLISKEIVADRGEGNDSLHRFKSGADIDEDMLVYAIRDAESDILRMQHYGFDEEQRFSVDGEKEFRFYDIELIRSPVIVDKEKVAFIGHKQGFAQIFLFDSKTKSLEQLTFDRNGYNTLDFSKEKNMLVFSKEDGTYGDFQDNLYTLDLSTKKVEQLLHAHFNSFSPQFSPDGSKVAFVGDEGGSYNLYVFDFKTERHAKVGDAKVAALRPMWIDEDEMIFNSVRMFMPTMHKTKVPGIGQLTVNDFGATLTERLPFKHQSSFDDFMFKDGEMFLDDEGKKLKVVNFAFNEGVLYFEAKPTDKELNKRTKFFRYEYALEDLVYADEPVEKIIAGNSEFLELMKGLEKDATIIKAAVSTDERYIAFAINTRMSYINKVKEDFADDNPITVCLYDSKEEEIDWLPLIKGIDSTSDIVNMRFVEDNLLLQFGEWLIYDIDKKKYVKPFKSVEHNKTEQIISEDGNFIAVLGEHAKDNYESIQLYDVLKEKLHSIGKFSEESVAHLKFVADGRLLFGKKKHDRFQMPYYLANPDDLSMEELKMIYPGEIEHIDVNDNYLVLKLKTGEDEEEKEHLFVGKFDEGVTLEKVFDDYKGFKGIVMEDGAFVVKAVGGNGSNNSEIIVYSVDKREKIKWLGLKNAVMDPERKNLILEDSEAGLCMINLEDMVEKLFVKDSFGFMLKGRHLIYSALKDNNYDIWEFDTETDISEALTISQQDEIFPMIINGKLTHIVSDKKAIMPRPKIILPKVPYAEKRVENEVSKWPFDSMYGSLMAAASTSAFFLQTSVIAKDNLWDKILFLNYMGDFDTFNFGTLGYADATSNNMYQAFIRHVREDMIAGAAYTHSFPLSKYLKLGVTGSYEYQKMSYFDFEGKNHVLKAGFGLGYDTSIWNHVGPADGIRAYLNIEAGYSVAHNELSNLDINAGFRHYITPHPLVTIAYRAEAGTSHGMVPTLFLLGGNKTLRGVDFDSEVGNNYFLVGAEVRSPMIQVAGAIFNGPLRGLSGLTMGYDIELGVYGDVGKAWTYNLYDRRPYDYKNYSSPEPHWNVGWSLNVTTPIRLRLRFNQAIYGNVDGWNVFVGYDW